MAGDWIKWEKGLSRKREVLTIADQLGISRREAATVCMEVWEWMDSETENGHVAGVTLAGLNAIIGHAGSVTSAGQSCDGIATAMFDVGWLEVDADGSIVFPKYNRHNSDSAKKRGQAVHRKRNERQRLRAEAAAQARREEGKEGDEVSRRERDKNVTKPPPEKRVKSKEEEGKKKARAQFVKPTLAEVTAYCRERKNQIEPQGFIDHYTSNGWLVGGKSAMKDWKAAVRNWERNNFLGGKHGKPKERNQAGAVYDEQQQFKPL